MGYTLAELGTPLLLIKVGQEGLPISLGLKSEPGIRLKQLKT